MDAYHAVLSEVMFKDLLCRVSYLSYYFLKSLFNNISLQIKVQREVSMDQERVKFTLVGMFTVDLEKECDQMESALCCLEHSFVKAE
jgi:hypothetical protein